MKNLIKKIVDAESFPRQMKNGHVLFQTRKGFRVYGGAFLISLPLALPAAA